MAKKDKKKIEVNTPPVNEYKGCLEKMSIKDPNSLASQVNKDFLNAEQTKWLWIPQRAEDLKNYYGVTPAAEWPFKGASRIKSQFQRIVVDTLSGNLLKSIFLPEHPIRVNPAPIGKDSSNETLDNLRYVEELHNALQSKEYNLKQVLDKAIPVSLIESFCVLHPVYEYQTSEYEMDVKRWVAKETDEMDLSYDMETDSVTKLDGTYVESVNMDSSPLTPEELSQEMKEVVFHVMKEETIKDGISIKILNGYRFYMPLGTPGETPYEKVQRAPYVVHQLFYTIREVKQMQEQGYFENIEPVIATVYDRQRELLTYIKLQQAGFLLDTARLEYEYVEVLKWCGKWKINGKWRELIVWMDKGSTQILRVETNVFGIRPYFPLSPFPVDETPYGESLCQIIRPLVKEIDLLMRTITNIALMKSAPPKFFDPASGFNPSTVGNFGPNSWIPAREPARNILQPQSPEDPGVAMQMLQFLINIVERITGVSEVIQGQTSNKHNTTATEVQQALTRAGVRFDTLYDRYKEQLKPMFKYIHKLTLRNMPETKEIQLMGAENKGRLTKIHKSQLQGMYEFELEGNSIVTEQAELQNAMTLFQTVGQHPYVTYKPESIYYMLYNIVKRLNPIAMDKILPRPEEVQKIEQQNQEAQRQQEQMAMEMQKNQPNPEQQKLQIAQGLAQVDAQSKQTDMQLKIHEQNQNMEHKDQMHKQKLAHNAEKQAQEMAMMKQRMIAEQQQAMNQMMIEKARAREQAKEATKPEPKS